MFGQKATLRVFMVCVLLCTGMGVTGETEESSQTSNSDTSDTNSFGADDAAPVNPLTEKAILFELEAQPLSTALIQATRAAGFQLILDGKLVEGLQAQAIDTKDTLANALSLLLAETSLVFKAINATTIVISQGRPQREPAMVVIANRLESGFFGAGMTNPTALPVDPLEIPQSIIHFDQAQIQLMSNNSLDTVLEQVSGITHLGSSQGISSENTIRSVAAPPIVVNGWGGNGPGLAPDIDTIDSIQIVKGPSSTVRGSLQPGGMINVERKKPLNEQISRIKMVTGSWDHRQLLLDTTGPLNNASTNYRVIAKTINENGYRDKFENEEILLAPSLTLVTNSNTKFSIDGLYAKKAGIVDTYLPSQHAFSEGKEDLNQISTTRFYGEEWNKGEVLEKGSSFTIEQALGENSLLSFSGRYQEQNINAQYAYIVTPLETTSPYTVLRSALGANRDLSTEGAMTNWENNFSANNWEFKLVTGLTYEKLELGLESLQPTAIGDFLLSEDPNDLQSAISIFDAAAPSYGFQKPELVPAVSSDYQLTMNAAYVQLYSSFSADTHLLLGARINKIESRSINAFNFEGVDAVNDLDRQNTDSLRFGISHKVTDNTALWTNYNKGDSFSISRSSITQFEAGIKFSSSNNLINTQLVIQKLKQKRIYFLEESITVTGVENNLLPNQESQSIEWDVMLRPIQELTLLGAATWQKARYRSPTESQFDGKTPRDIPELTFSAWGSYFPSGNQNQGWGASLGLRYVDDRFFDNSNELEVDSYQRIDGAIHWRHISGWELDLRIQNLLNKKYIRGRATNVAGVAYSAEIEQSGDLVTDYINSIYKAILDPGGVIPSDPRSAFLTVAYGF